MDSVATAAAADAWAAAADAWAAAADAWAAAAAHERAAAAHERAAVAADAELGAAAADAELGAAAADEWAHTTTITQDVNRECRADECELTAEGKQPAHEQAGMAAVRAVKSVQELTAHGRATGAREGTAAVGRAAAAAERATGAAGRAAAEAGMRFDGSNVERILAAAARRL